MTRHVPVLNDISAAADYAWRGGRLLAGFLAKRPIHCIVQVSNRCNLTCGFCSFWERPAPPEDERLVSLVALEGDDAVTDWFGGDADEGPAEPAELPAPGRSRVLSVIGRESAAGLISCLA